MLGSGEQGQVWLAKNSKGLVAIKTEKEQCDYFRTNNLIGPEIIIYSALQTGGFSLSFSFAICLSFFLVSLKKLG